MSRAFVPLIGPLDTASPTAGVGICLGVDDIAVGTPLGGADRDVHN